MSIAKPVSCHQNKRKGMEVTDPIPYIKKKTKIDYVINGKRKSITLKAGPNRKYNLLRVLK